MVSDEEFRSAWPRVVRALAAWCGSLDAAEEHAAEAFARLVTTAGSAPDDVVAWCIQVAKRAFIDDQRRGSRFARLSPALAGPGRLADAALRIDDMDPDDLSAGLDDRLALLFVACDDTLPRGAQLVLALRVVCGLSIPEIADHLGIKHTAAAARLTRAKAALAAARGEFQVPGPEQRLRRLPAVLDCVAGMYTVAHREGFAPLDPLEDLGGQALSIAAALVSELPDEPEVRGLRALVLLGLARRPGRLDADGVALTLDEVDRTRWDRRLADAGLEEAARAVRLLDGVPPQRFVLESAISGLHTLAPSTQATDWPQVLALYGELSRRWPSPAVEVAALCARARAQPQDTAEVESGLTRIAAEGPTYARRDAEFALADLLWRTGRRSRAAQLYAGLAEQARAEPVRRFCLRRSG